MTFEEAIKHENNSQPVIYNSGKYYVIGHNRLSQTITIQQSNSLPIEVKELNE